VGQWGFSGWGMTEGVARVFVQHLGDISGKRVLELGTSRGYLTLILCQLGAHVTTVDPYDRGARKNLQGLAAEVVVMSGQAYLRKTDTVFDVICIDVHGNGWRRWRNLWPQVAARVKVGGKVVIDNATLHTIKEWAHEDGVYRLFERLRHDPSWKCSLIEQPLPGVLVLERLA
jgi:predicted O-methyltransferase YrrM